jgi:AraC-like DNA-binding protein
MGDAANSLFWGQTVDEMRFYLEMPPSPTADLTVVASGRERCRPHYLVARDGFPYQCIEFVLSGEGELELAGRRFKLRPGTVFSYGPGVPHRIANSKSKPMTKYFADFSGRRAAGLLASIPLEHGTPMELNEPAQAYRLFEELIRQGLGMGRNSQVLCAKLLECLCLAIAQTAMPHGSLSGKAASSFMRCKETIQARFMEIESLQALASACGLETAYMCRLFKKFERTSPYNYILRLRMGRAAELLRNGRSLVKEVACACGFQDEYQFSRCFKSVYGIAPGQYRTLSSKTVGPVAGDPCRRP